MAYYVLVLLGLLAVHVQDEGTSKGELHGSGASSNAEPLGAALAKIIAMLVEKHNCSMAVFKDETLFWNWAKNVSDDPLLQAISIAGPAIFREARHLMRKTRFPNAGQGDCLATDFVPASHWSDKEPLAENLANLALGEMASKPSISGGKDLLAMGDVTTEPAKDSDDSWCGGFDPTREFDYLDFEQEDIASAEGRLAECSGLWPNTSVSSRSESQMTQISGRTCSSSSLPGKNSKEEATDNLSQFGAFMKEDSSRAGTWNPTWLEDFIRACPNAEVPPIFQKIRDQMEGAAARKAAAAHSEAYGTESKASSSGSFADSSLSKNKRKDPSLQKGHSAGHNSASPSVQVDCGAAEWAWKAGSNGDMTTAAPWSPIRLGNKVFPEINSSNIEELRNELEAELDTILRNLYELSQAWDTLFSTCGASQGTLPLQQPGAAPPNHPYDFVPHGTLPNTRLPYAQAQAAFTTAFNQQLPLGPRPTGFFMPNMHTRPETPRQNFPEFNAHLGAFAYGQPESNQYMPRYSMPSSVGAPLHSSLISSNSGTGGFVSSDARANLAVPSAEQVAHGATFSSTPGRSRSYTANLSEASHKISTRSCPPNCSVEVSTYTNELPPTYVPNFNATMKVKPSSLATPSLQHTPVYATNLPGAGYSSVSTMEAAHTVPPAGIRKIQMPQAHTPQPRTFELSNTQSYGFPQKILLPNRSMANNAQGSTSDASTSEASNISGKPFLNVFHSNATNELAVPEPSLPGPLQAGTDASSKSLPNLLQSTNLPPGTSLPDSSVCATAASDTLSHDTLTTVLPKNSPSPPTLPASVGNLNFGTIPWTLPRPSSHPSHETSPRPPAWHQRGPVPWSTQGARAGPVNCPLPGHVAPVRVPQLAANQPPGCTLVSPHLNCSVAVHVPPVRASPPSAHRNSTNTLASPQFKSPLAGHAPAVRASSPSVNRPPALANPQMRLGPRPVPRQPWHTSWAPSWPAHARWPMSSWPPLASANRNPPEHVPRPLARPMHGSALSPATWPPLRAGPAVVRQPITELTSVCGIVPSPSFGQVAKLPAHRPPIATSTAGASTPQTPVTDSLLGPRPQLPPPPSSGSTSSSCSTAPQPNVKPALTNATSSASVTSTTSTNTSPPSTAPPQPTAVHVASNVAAPISRYSAVPAPRHAARIAQGRCFKAGVAPGTKTALLNPVPRLPPRLASKLATRQPATPSCVSNSNSSKLCPEADKPVNQPCKDTQMVPEATDQQPANDDPKECDVKAQTKTEDCEQNTKGECSPCTAPSVGPGSAWRKTPNIKGLAGAPGHNLQDGTGKQTETAPAPPEKNRQETAAVSNTHPHPTSGRRRKRR